MLEGWDARKLKGYKYEIRISKSETIFKIQIYQCSKQIKQLLKVHKSSCLCYLNFGYLVIVSCFVLWYSDLITI